jgi:mono/diheme cytochrome c family protein
MKSRSTVLWLVFLLLLSTASWAADEGASLYKGKCAGCHGPNGEGKPAMKAPALKGTSLEVGQVADRITKGAPGSKAPHNKGMNGVTSEQATVIAEYVKSLK